MVVAGRGRWGQVVVRGHTARVTHGRGPRSQGLPAAAAVGRLELPPVPGGKTKESRGYCIFSHV